MNAVVFALVVVMRLLVVKEVQTGDQETVLVFESGEKASLLKSDKGYEGFLRLAARSRERKVPVGVGIETPDKTDKPDKPAEPEASPAKPAHIAEIVRASSDTVLEVVQSQKDPTVYKVRLQAHDGILTLRSDHAEFKRISALLADSIKNKTRIWFVAKPDLTLLDAIPAEPPKDDGKKPGDKGPALPGPGDEPK